MKSPYTLRSYAFLIDVDQHFILLKEHINNKYYVKLPGGGLENFETPIMSLHRELREELALPKQEVSLVHVTENPVYSAFAANKLVLGFYYFGRLDSRIQAVSQEGAELIFASANELITLLDFETDQEAASRLLADQRFVF